MTVRGMAGRRGSIVVAMAGAMLLAGIAPAPGQQPDPAAAGRLMDELMWGREPVGGPFSLTDHTGRTRTDAEFRGKLLLVYFGYTFCPDVCPTSLSSLAQALSALTPVELAQVKSFFISVDPDRDTMAVLKAYAPFFHPSLVGLSGTNEQVAQVARQYGAFYMKQKPDANGLYSVDHSSFIYVIAPDGKLAASLPHGTLPTQIVDMIRSQFKH